LYLRCGVGPISGEGSAWAAGDWLVGRSRCGWWIRTVSSPRYGVVSGGGRTRDVGNRAVSSAFRVAVGGWTAPVSSTGGVRVVELGKVGVVGDLAGAGPRRVSPPERAPAIPLAVGQVGRRGRWRVSGWPNSARARVGAVGCRRGWAYQVEDLSGLLQVRLSGASRTRRGGRGPVRRRLRVPLAQRVCGRRAGGAGFGGCFFGGRRCLRCWEAGPPTCLVPRTVHWRK